MKKNFLEAIRDLFRSEVQSEEPKVSGDLLEVEKWQAKVSDRCYNKNDLVCFVQYGHEKNEDDVYFMCGYLNADGARFRDLSTGAVYGVFDAPYPDRNTIIGESMRATISYGKNSFVRVEPSVLIMNDCRGSRGINIGLTGTALSSTTNWYLTGDDEGLVLTDYLTRNGGSSHTLAPALYNLFIRDYDDEIVSGKSVLIASNQANKCCIDNVNKEAERRQRIAEGGHDASIKDASLTPEELDF